MHLVDPPHNHVPADPIPFDDAPDRPGFPVFILAAPGLLCMLALALPDALARTMKTTPALWVATTVAAAGALLCFGIITARSRENEVRYPAIAALVGAVLLTLRAILQLL